MKWNEYLLVRPHSLIHPPICITHSLSNSLKNKARTLGTRRGKIGESVEENEGEEEGDNISIISWTPFTPQPHHGKLKKNHRHFLGNPLIHLFGMVQEKAHVEPSQV